MYLITLDGETDFDGWRKAARGWRCITSRRRT
jgi:hypothetical protein